MHVAKRILVIFCALFGASLSLSAATPAKKLVPRVIGTSRHDISPPLRSLTNVRPAKKERDENDNPLLPKARMNRPTNLADPVLQSVIGPSIPAPIANFDGMNNIDGVYPPDTNGDVGGNYYVEWVNLHLQVFDKTTGASLLGPIPGNAIWSGFGGICQTNNNGDPIVLYDHLANRWMISQFALATNNYHQCIAISQTSDPTASWYRYDFAYSNVNMNDYPHFGVWPDGYYMSVNQFANASSWAGAGVVVFERDKMLQGLPARELIFDIGAINMNYGNMLPSHLNGAPPASGEPNYFWEFDDSSWIGPNDALRMWKFHVDWINIANSTFGLSGEPNNVINVAAFNPSPCVGVTRNCVPQPGTAVKLDGVADRLMYRVQYRNFGDHESVVLNHTVDAGGGRHGIRWYELRDMNTTPSIFQQGTYAPADTEHRWMASVAMDASGDVGMGFSTSSGTVSPSVRYTGRLVSDPAGTMPQGEGTFIAGTGSQTGSGSRWGDYSAMSVDPTDGCTFYYANEYIQTTGTAPWRTRIASFKFPSCTATPAGTLQGHVTDATTLNPISGAIVDAGGYTGITDATGLYSIANLSPGTYDVTASAFGYTPQTVNGVAITAGNTTNQDFALSGAVPVTLDGTVSDGSGGNTPLYAKISVSGNSVSVSTFTDPVTGHYSIQLVPTASPYSVKAESVYPGYDAKTDDVVVNADTTHDFQLAVGSACAAPGYSNIGVAMYQTFDTGSLPGGWSVNTTAGPGWSFNDPGGRTNLTGGSGGFAIADSDHAGTTAFDSSLVSPALDLSSYASVILDYNSDFRWYSNGLAEVADTDVSIDGGATWTNVRRLQGGSERGPKFVSIDISAVAAGQANVQVRFRYYNANFEWWWEVDNVKVHALNAPGCTPLGGGYVVGNVYNGQNNTPLNGANVTDGTSNTNTAATPDDPALDDGFYWLWSPTGSHTYTASLPPYGSLSRDLNVAAGSATRQNFTLGTAVIAASPTTFTVRLNAGQTVDQTTTLTNYGAVDGTYVVEEMNTPVSAPFHGNVERSALVVPADKQAERTAQSVISKTPAPDVPVYPNAGEVIGSWSTGLAYPWGIGFDLLNNDMWIGNVQIAGGDDKDYRFLRNGTNTGDSINTHTFTGTVFQADMAYDPFTKMLWQVNVGNSEFCIYELDPVTKAPTGNKICPAFGTSERGLAFDPTTDTFFAGTWNNQTIVHFDRSGNILDSKNVGLNVSGLAFNPTTKHLFVATNSAGNWDAYVLDASNANYAMLGAFNVSGLGDGQQAGLEMSCDGHLWFVNQATQEVLEVNSGEETSCSLYDIPWVSENPTAGTLAVNASQDVTLSFITAGQPFGLQRAQLNIKNDSPTAPVVLNFTKAFSDVSAASPFDRFIHGMAGAGVTQGCGGNNFCPTANTTRGAMAAWLLKAKFGGTYTPPAPTGQIFNDISTETANAAFIEDFYARGITAGCSSNPPLYCPDNSVTRQQMAVFLLVTKEGNSYVPPPAVGIFSDVPVSSPFAKWVEELYNRGITAGCGVNPLRYCPTNPITRQQMAVFVVTTFGIPHL